MNHPLTKPQQYTQIAAAIALLTGASIPLRAIGVVMQQGTLVIALILALFLLIRDPVTKISFKAALTSTTGMSIALIFVAFSITIPFSHAPLGSLKIGGRTGIFLLASMAVWAAVITHRESHRLLLKGLIVTSVSLTLLSLMSLAGTPYIVSTLTGGQVANERPDLFFKAFSASAMCLIPVIIWAGRQLNGNWRWFSYAFVTLSLALIFITYNRSALAGLIAIISTSIIVLALAKYKHAKVMAVTAIATIGGIVAWISKREGYSLEILRSTANKAPQLKTYLPGWLLDPHRQNIWNFAFERFLEHPWAGNGIDQLNRLPGADSTAPGLDRTAAMLPSHPHNWILEILSETGLIGFLPMVTVLIYLAWKLMKNYLRTGDEADLALLTLMAGFWVSALFNFSIWAVWWQLTFFILFAIILATRPRA